MQPNSSIIYNSMNYDAVIAAAIVKSHFPDVEVVDVAKQVPHGSEVYYWIGIEPAAKNIHHYNISTAQKHVVFLNHPNNVIASEKKEIRFTVFGQKEESYDSSFDSDDHPVPELPPTLIDKVLRYFGIESSEYHKLTLASAIFHRKTTEFELLVYLYSNLKEASDCLTRGVPYKVIVPNEQHGIEYLEQARIIKADLANNYKVIPILDGNNVRMAIYTTINDFRIHMTLRIIKLSHHNFMNMSLGLNGQIAYTNLVNPGFDDSKDQPLLLK